MSISLTWANYALIVSVCLGVYYAVVGVIFYSARIIASPANEEGNSISKADTNGNSISDAGNKNLFGEEVSEDIITGIDEQDLNPEAQDFADEIVAYTSSCEENITKEKLVQSIQQIIQKYPSLKDSNHKYELNQLIAISTENYCSIHVSAEELSEMWRD